MTISPRTPPGTIVVCRNNSGRAPELTVGKVYTVRSIVEAEDEDFGALLIEVDEIWEFDEEGQFRWVYHLDRFDLAVLPKEITDILCSVPIDALVSS